MIKFEDYLLEVKQKNYYQLEIISTAGKLVAIKECDYYKGAASLTEILKSLENNYINFKYNFLCSHEIQRLIAKINPAILVHLYELEKTLDPSLKNELSHILLGNKFSVFKDDEE